MARETVGFAVIQYPDTVFGIGLSANTAWADAAQWLDGKPAVPASQPRVDGALYCLPCTGALWSHVRAGGSKCECDGDRVYARGEG